MNSNKCIESIYGMIKAKYGKSRAKSAVKSMLGNILDDLETEGLEVSEKNISERLKKYADDFAEASKADVA
jgi:hypothetical protein